MAGHLLTLEHLAGVLALAGRTVRTVRDRVAVSGTTAAEIVAFDDAGKALADRRARDIHELADDEMIGGQLGADIDHVVLGDAELDDLPLRLDLRDREMAAQCLAGVLDLAEACAELERGVTVLLGRALSHDLAIVEPENGDGNLFPRLRVDPGHADLLGDDA